MRLLHCVHSCNPEGGGVWEAVNQFAQSHQSRGHEVQIATLDDPHSPWCNNNNVNLRALGPTRGYGFSLKFQKWLRSNAQEYDCVVVHGLWQYHGYAVMKSCSELEVPYFVYPHGMLDPWFKYSNRLKHIKKLCYWKLVEHRVLGNASGVIFTCEEEKRLAYGTFKPFNCRPFVAPLGVREVNGNANDQSNLFYDTYPQLREKSYILFLGRIHPKKGLDLLFEALLNIDQYIPDLVIAGPVDDYAYQKSFDKFIEGIRAKQNDWQCEWVGMLSGDTKWGALRSADVFVLPSHQENFGIAVVEALSVGTPVLITQKVNIYREILESEAGYAAEDSITGIKDMMVKWISLGQKAKATYSKNAKKCYYKNFEINQASDHLENVLLHSLP